MRRPPQAEARVRAARFERQFEERVGGVRGDAATLRAACGEVRGCALLPGLLMTCLAVGNFLNSGNRAGAAAGFQIESLLKLRAVRSPKHPGRTLLHYVALQARFICRSYSVCLCTCSPFSPCDCAAGGVVGHAMACASQSGVVDALCICFCVKQPLWPFRLINEGKMSMVVFPCLTLLWRKCRCAVRVAQKHADSVLAAEPLCNSHIGFRV